MKKYAEAPGEFLVGERIKYNKITNSFYIYHGDEVLYNLYVDEIQQMIEILAREKKIEFLMVVNDKSNHAVLTLSPKVKWRGTE